MPAPDADHIVAEMQGAGYDVTRLTIGPDPDTTVLQMWIFAGQSALQAELLLKRLAPEARLLSR